MRFLNFLFYRFYQFANAMGNEGFFPEVNAWFLTTLLVWGNVCSVLILLKLFVGLSKKYFSYLIIASFVVWVVTWVYFMRGDNYKVILSEFDKESASVKKKNTILMIAYSILTVLLYLYVSEL